MTISIDFTQAVYDFTLVSRDVALTAAIVTGSGSGSGGSGISDFASRSAFVSAAPTLAPTIGTVIVAAGFAYRWISSGTAISDLPGWVPHGEAYPDHFAENVTPGTTLMGAAINAALAYAPKVKGTGIYATDQIITINNKVFAGLSLTGCKIYGVSALGAANPVVRCIGSGLIMDASVYRQIDAGIALAARGEYVGIDIQQATKGRDTVLRCYIYNCGTGIWGQGTPPAARPFNWALRSVRIDDWYFRALDVMGGTGCTIDTVYCQGNLAIQVDGAVYLADSTTMVINGLNVHQTWCGINGLIQMSGLYASAAHGIHVENNRTTGTGAAVFVFDRANIQITGLQVQHEAFDGASQTLFSFANGGLLIPSGNTSVASDTSEVSIDMVGLQGLNNPGSLFPGWVNNLAHLTDWKMVRRVAGALGSYRFRVGNVETEIFGADDSPTERALYADFTTASVTTIRTNLTALATVATTGAFSDLVSHPTTLAGYGITDGGGGGGGISDGDKGDVVVSGGGTVWSIDYTAVNATIAPIWSRVTGKPTTIAGYAISDAVDIGSAQTITGAKTFSGNVTLTDANLFLLDDADPTKKAKFQLSAITTGTTQFYTLPDVSGTFPILSVAQTFTNINTFSNANNNFGTATTTGTIGLSVGAATSGQTKTVQIGIAGLSGSITNITLGSAVTGALGSMVINSPTISFGPNVATFAMPDSAFALQAVGDPTKQVKFGLAGITTGTTRTLTVPNADGTLRLTSDTTALTGDVTGTGATSIAATLATVNANVGSFGSASAVPVVTADAKGRITGLVSTAISILAVAISDATAAGRAFLTAASATAQTALLDLATVTTKGLVPPPGTSSGKVLSDNLTWVTPSGGSGSPGGSTTQIQFNDAAAFGGDADLTWDKTTNTLGLGGTDTGIELAGITTEPAAPAAGKLRQYVKSVAGRLAAKVKGPSGLDTYLQAAFWGNNITMWNPTAATAGAWLGTTGAGAGTYTTGLPTATNLYTALKRGLWANVVTTANQVLGQRNTELMYMRGSVAGQGGFFFFARAGFDVWTNGGRFFAGMHRTTAVASADPSTNNNCCGFAVDAADNGLIYFITRDATTTTRVSTGLTITTNAGYDLYMFCAPNDSKIGWRIVDFVNGVEASGSATTNLPINTLPMNAGVLASNAALTAATAIQMGLNRIYVETDY